MKTAGLEQVVSTAAQHVQTALQQGEHIPSLLCTRVVGSKRACIPPKRHFVSLTHSLAPPSACLLCALLSSLLMCAPALSLLLCAHLCTPPNTAVSFTAHRGATICAARAGEFSSRSPDVNNSTGAADEVLAGAVRTCHLRAPKIQVEPRASVLQ